MLKPLLLIALTLAATPALAGATAWQELAPGVRARLISSDTIVDGTSSAGLEIDMPRGTKTYWRIPGETGIPTEFDFSGSSGVADPTLHWPFPQIDHADGYTNYVYHGPVVVPLVFHPDGTGGTLKVAVTLGICSDMCVPAQAAFALPLSFAAADPGQSIRLAQAEATAPIAWDRPGAAVGAVTLGADGIAIADPDPAIAADTLIADVGDPAILFQTPQKSPDGKLLTLPLLGGAAVALEGRTVQLTFMTPAGPYTVTRRIGAAR